MRNYPNISRLKTDPQTIEDFWARVDVRGPDDCWEWQGTRSEFGYGRLHLRGTRSYVTTHRLSLAIHKGLPPSYDMLALHECDNAPCCNPKHLRWGTYQDNSDDKIKRKGPLRGEGNPRCRISRTTAEEIYSMRMDGYGIGAIADSLDLPYTLVENVYTGRSWKHLLGIDGNPTIEQLRAKRTPRKKRTSSNRIISDDMIDDIYRMRLDGLTAKEIGEKIGLSEGTVSPVFCGNHLNHRLGRHGNPTLEQLRSIRKTTAKITEEQVSEIRGRLGSGEKAAALAKEYGVSPATICNIRKGKR